MKVKEKGEFITLKVISLQQEGFSLSEISYMLGIEVDELVNCYYDFILALD